MINIKKWLIIGMSCISVLLNAQQDFKLNYEVVDSQSVYIYSHSRAIFSESSETEAGRLIYYGAEHPTLKRYYNSDRSKVVIYEHPSKRVINFNISYWITNQNAFISMRTKENPNFNIMSPNGEIVTPVVFSKPIASGDVSLKGKIKHVFSTADGKYLGKDYEDNQLHYVNSKNNVYTTIPIAENEEFIYHDPGISYSSGYCSKSGDMYFSFAPQATLGLSK